MGRSKAARYMRRLLNRPAGRQCTTRRKRSKRLTLEQLGNDEEDFIPSQLLASEIVYRKDVWMVQHGGGTRLVLKPPDSVWIG